MDPTPSVWADLFSFEGLGLIAGAFLTLAFAVLCVVHFLELDSAGRR